MNIIMLFLVSVLMILPAGSESQAYQGEPGFIKTNEGFKPIAVPWSDETELWGINDHGDIVGRSYVPNTYGLTGFLFNKQFSFFGYPNAIVTIPRGINNMGIIVGSYLGVNGQGSFIKDQTGYTNFPDINISPHVSVINGINDSGQIVGLYFTGDFNAGNGYEGFLKNGDNYLFLNYPNGVGTYAKGINNKGEIVGNYFPSKSSINTHGFLFTGGNYFDIAFPGADETDVEAINDAGDIVGSYYVELSGEIHGFLKKQDGYFTIDYPDAEYTFCNGINNLGQIVGHFVPGSTPPGAPIPGTILLLGTGIGYLAIFRRGKMHAKH